MIRYAAEALDDVERLYRWLLERDAATAGNWLTRLQEAEALIARAPTVGRGPLAGLRGAISCVSAGLGTLSTLWKTARTR